MEYFDLGKRVTTKNRRGEVVEIGEYNLHVDCTWRVIGPRGIVVGVEDFGYPPDSSLWEKWNLKKDPSRGDTLLQAWLKKHEKNLLVITSIEADAIGGFRLFLAHGFTLDVLPTRSKGEHWRFLIDREKLSRQFVCYNRNAAWT
jgi:hypothetical protein